MNDNNVEKRGNFETNGKFAKGNNVAKGKRKRTQTDKLLAALKKRGVTEGEKFWDRVAEKAFKDKDIMKAVINKLVPNVNELTGPGGEPLNITLREIIYGKDEKEGEKGKSKEAET